jgi:hypothetical protein
MREEVNTRNKNIITIVITYVFVLISLLGVGLINRNVLLTLYTTYSFRLLLGFSFDTYFTTLR